MSERATTRLRSGPGGRLPAPGGAANERGMILVLTLLVLLVLSMVAGTSLINGILVRSQARSEANAAIALHAAEAGVAAGMAWLSDPANTTGYVYPQVTGDVPDPSVIADAYTTRTAWQGWSHSLSESFANGGGYTTTIRFKRERRDRSDPPDADCCDTYPAVPIDEDSEFRDGDDNSCAVCPGEVVLFNHGNPDPDDIPATPDGDGLFGFAHSFFSGTSRDEGFPVIEIVSVGTHGASAVREIALFVARNHKAQVEGAFTTRTPLDPAMNKEIDGTNAGSPACGDDLPGITVDVGMALPCNDANSDGDCADANECDTINKVTGSICAQIFDPTAPGKRPLPKTPWDALGMTEVDFRSLFEARYSDTLDTTNCKPGEAVNLWFTADLANASPKKSCNGILVVHNPKFDPDKWDPASPGYDAAYAAEPSNAPASFAIVGGGNLIWDGIVIADQVGRVNGNVEVNGGVISLASGGDGVITELQGSFSVRYDCDQVAAVSKQIGYKKKIGWQRVR